MDGLILSSNNNELTETIRESGGFKFQLPQNVEEFAKKKVEPQQEIEQEPIERQSLVKVSRALNRLVLDRL